MLWVWVSSAQQLRFYRYVFYASLNCRSSEIGVWKCDAQKALARSFVDRLNKRRTIALCRCSELLNGNLIERRVRMRTAGTGALLDCWTVCMCLCMCVCMCLWHGYCLTSFLGLVSSGLVSNQWQVKGVAGMKPYRAAISLTSQVLRYTQPGSAV